MKTYYYLKHNEIIKEGDEVEVSNGWNADPRWVKETRCVGKRAPDPRFPAHRTYRRLIKEATPKGER